MLSRKPVFALLLGAMLFGCAGNAFAQTEEDFRTRMAEVAPIVKTDLSEALHRYLEIRAVYGGRQIDYALGRTYQKLYQCENAQYYYTQVMVAYNLSPDDPVYARAVSDYDTIAACDSWQKVQLKCTVSAGDIIMIDESKFSECWNRPFALPDGDHTIKIVSPDGREQAVEITTLSGADDMTVELSIPVEPEKIPPSKEECADFTPEPVNVEYRERFHPALYWGLIAGGALFLGGSGWFSAMANNALVDVQKYEDRYSVLGDESYKKKANDARDKVDLGNILMYTSIGVGSALAATGIALAIVSAISPKEKIETGGDVSAFVTPANGGAIAGFGLTF